MATGSLTLTLLGFLLVGHASWRGVASGTTKATTTTSTPPLNLLLNKPIQQSSLYRSWINSTDGKLNTWSVTQPSRYDWIVVDMQAINTVTGALVYNDDEDNTVPYIDVMVASSFNPCEVHIWSQFTTCGRILVNVANLTSQVTCTSPVSGQFVMFKYGNPNDTTGPELTISVAEIQAFGTVGSSSGIQVAPTLDLTSAALPSLKTLFPIRAVMLAGTTSVTLPYGVGQIYFGNSNSEAILYDASYQRAVMVATTYNQGRMITMGNAEWLTAIRTSSSSAVLWAAMQAWLRAGTGLTGSLRNVTDSWKDGDIVIIEGYQSILNATTVATLLSKLSQGKNAVIHAISGWKLSPALETLPQFALCNATAVYITISQVTWSSQSWTVNATDNYLGMLPLQTALQKALTIPYVLGQIDVQFDKFQTMASYQVWSYNLSSLAQSVINQYKSFIHYNTPCDVRPLTDQVILAPFVYGFNRLSLTPLMVGSGYKSDALYNFPGDYDTPPATKTKKLQITAYLKTEFHPTGLYLPAGVTLNFTINSLTASGPKDWNIRISCHDDNVWHTNSWSRMPLVFVTRSMDFGQVFSPFGGLIWIQSTIINSSITVTFPSAVEAPFFNLRDPANIANYNTRRNAPGLWADIAGDAMILCIPSYLMRNNDVTYAQNVIQNYMDKMVKIDYDMLGEDWRYQRRQRAVIDLQVEAGYGHSGYPIMGTLGWADDFWNLTYITTQTWGMCHETGHNMQNGDWTWSGTVEVTVNIFCLANYVTLFNIPLNVTSMLASSQVASDNSYLYGGAKSFNDWYDDEWMALAVYYQLGTCFGFGLYKKVFSAYPLVYTNMVTGSTQSKIDTWVYAVSQTVQKNVQPFFDFWGFPISASMSQNVSSLPCIFPSDNFTQTVSNWTTVVQAKYNNKCSNTCNPMTYPNMVVFTPIMPNDVVELQ